MEIDPRVPFAGSSVALGSCSLEPVGPSNAAELARALAGMDPWRTLGYRPELLSRYLARKDAALHRFAVSIRGTAAGCFCIRHPWLMGPFLELLAVFPGFQGKGLGGTLVRWLEGEVRPSCRNIWTTVSSFNASAARFYEHMGFAEVGILRGLIMPGFDEILLRKAVDFTAEAAESAERTI